MSVFKKLIAAGPNRLSRLHDAEGNLVGLSELARNGSKAFSTGVRRLTSRKLPDLPWISYDAQKIIGAKLTRASRVLEFGSGMSTAWWAARAGEVIAIEASAEWREIVLKRFSSMGIDNAQLRLAPTRSEYLELPSALRGDGFDLIMVDGEYRADCIEIARNCLRPGGMVYLDNSDVEPDAKKNLTQLAKERGATIRLFTDFAPTAFFVQQGMLATFP